MESNKSDNYSLFIKWSIIIGLIVFLISLSVIDNNRYGTNASIESSIAIGLMYLLQVLALIASFGLIIYNVFKNKKRILSSLINFIIWAIGLAIWS